MKRQCEDCRRLEADQADYDRFAEGEGEHLCWGDVCRSPVVDFEVALRLIALGDDCVPGEAWRAVAREALVAADVPVEVSA